MGDMNWDRERERLIALYAGLQDGELKDIASEIEELTAVARAALLAEMSKRGMRTPPASSPSTFVSPESRDITREPEAPPPIRLRRYRGMPEAMIAGSILDSAAIECFLVDDNLVRMNWFYSDAIGGIKLLVRPDDSAAADE